ncbi:Sec-independent protein translocase subunit TatA [Sphaerisporangium viridialbum]|uniref:Sec-independent protein translocase subunit TatA n=1 Tax=Sphaerisporangium viridialbum TaxID=46189 RepID=UPI003C7708E3
MGSLSPMHWMIVAVVFVLLFGAKKLPDTAKAVGQSLRILKKETTKLRDEDEAPDGQPITPVAQTQITATSPTIEERLRTLEEENARLKAASASQPHEDR